MNKQWFFAMMVGVAAALFVVRGDDSTIPSMGTGDTAPTVTKLDDDVVTDNEVPDTEAAPAMPEDDTGARNLESQDEPDNTEALDNPEVMESPDEPDHSEMSESPDESDNPEAVEHSEDMEGPDVMDHSEELVTPDEPDSSEVTD